ncbi:stress response RCI peptide [Coccidioides immitis RS]|uniref:Stress response RCI peptide n=2 Tax=Coccidioides immitis TaxID=5501 RepID=J3K8D0_COCIM|nr:stress response RCI peptide [Coccidioides immitis RS]EAS31063.3 stress response RCI peptide [Coccidioides immitis RS]KMU74634.1 hypothetical protein CISG_00564 [Coccidioides immitis RMSCC 3703]
MSETCAAVILIVVTLFLPPLGVFFISGCSADFLINILLTLLGYFPGHIHAFYCEYVYYDRRARGHEGRSVTRPAPGIFSRRIQNGGVVTREYIFPPPPTAPAMGSYPNTPVQNKVRQNANASTERG